MTKGENGQVFPTVKNVMVNPAKTTTIANNSTDILYITCRLRRTFCSSIGGGSAIYSSKMIVYCSGFQGCARQ